MKRKINLQVLKKLHEFASNKKNLEKESIDFHFGFYYRKVYDCGTLCCLDGMLPIIYPDLFTRNASVGFSIPAPGSEFEDTEDVLGLTIDEYLNIFCPSDPDKNYINKRLSSISPIEDVLENLKNFIDLVEYGVIV